MKNLILYFFLFILEVSFNFILDIVYKYNRFSDTLLKKGFKYILSDKIGSVLFFLMLYVIIIKS